MIITTRQLKNIISEALLVESRLDDVIRKYIDPRIIKYINSEMFISQRNMDSYTSAIKAIAITREGMSREEAREETKKLKIMAYLIDAGIETRSSKNKYLDWMANQALNYNEPVVELVNTVAEFEKYRHISPREINSYKTLGELRAAIEGDALKRTQKIKVSPDQYDRIYEDNNAIVIHPKTKEASCKYGAGTKWCIAATKSANYFDSYDSDGWKHYFLIRKSPKGDNFDKISASVIPELVTLDEINQDHTGFDICDTCDNDIKRKLYGFTGNEIYDEHFSSPCPACNDSSVDDYIDGTEQHFTIWDAADNEIPEEAIPQDLKSAFNAAARDANSKFDFAEERASLEGELEAIRERGGWWGL